MSTIHAPASLSAHGVLVGPHGVFDRIEASPQARLDTCFGMHVCRHLALQHVGEIGGPKAMTLGPETKLALIVSRSANRVELW